MASEFRDHFADIGQRPDPGFRVPEPEALHLEITHRRFRFLDQLGRGGNRGLKGIRLGHRIEN